jgi:hypothetical protein
MRESINRSRLHKWEAMCGVGCFIAGILAPLLGMFLLAIEWLVGVVVHPSIHVAGTALLIAGIPLIVFAGFCLDWAEAGKKAASHDRARSQRGAASLLQIAAIMTLLTTLLIQP